MRIALTFLLSLGLLHAQDDEEKKPDSKPEEITKVTHQDSVTIDGKKIEYRATAANLLLKDPKGDDRASIFHVTYERMGIKDRSKRPVMFAFNGGPGSSAVWLHLGALGPRIVPTTQEGTKTLPPPKAVIEDPHSIIDIADLVFIDPVSTGFSRSAGEAEAGEFHGVQGDIESVGDFIRRWVSENDRWASPKYLLGESYGGIRAAGLSDHLQDEYGMSLNGVVMLSSLLDFRTLRSYRGDNLSYQIYLPAMAAISHYHKKVEGDRDELYNKALDYAHGDFAKALLKGAAISAVEKAAVAKQMAEFTGLPSKLFEEVNLRISPTRYRKELLRDENKVIGRFDARTAWPAIDKVNDYAGYDPSYSVIYGAFSTAMNDYLSRTLNWEGHHPYKILTGEVHPWDWNSDNRVLNVSTPLENALIHNPDLRVLVMVGYGDFATPPSGMQYSVNHLFRIPDARRKAIEFAWYEAGHMFYLNQPDLAKMRLDLVKFINN